MKKFLIVMLSFSLIFIFSAVGFAQDLGPQIGELEGVFTGVLNTGGNANADAGFGAEVGARMWLGDLGEFVDALEGIKYGAGVKTDFVMYSQDNILFYTGERYQTERRDHSSQALGVLGNLDLDLSNYLVEFFDPAEIFTSHGLEVRVYNGIGYYLDFNSEETGGHDEEGYRYSRYETEAGVGFKSGTEIIYPIMDDLDLVFNSGFRSGPDHISGSNITLGAAMSF